MSEAPGGEAGGAGGMSSISVAQSSPSNGLDTSPTVAFQEGAGAAVWRQVHLRDAIIAFAHLETQKNLMRTAKATWEATARYLRTGRKHEIVKRNLERVESSVCSFEHPYFFLYLHYVKCVVEMYDVEGATSGAGFARLITQYPNLRRFHFEWYGGCFYGGDPVTMDVTVDSGEPPKARVDTGWWATWDDDRGKEQVFEELIASVPPAWGKTWAGCLKILRSFSPDSFERWSARQKHTIAHATRLDVIYGGGRDTDRDLTLDRLLNDAMAGRQLQMLMVVTDSTGWESDGTSFVARSQAHVGRLIYDLSIQSRLAYQIFRLPELRGGAIEALHFGIRWPLVPATECDLTPLPAWTEEGESEYSLKEILITVDRRFQPPALSSWLANSQGVQGVINDLAHHILHAAGPLVDIGVIFSHGYTRNDPGGSYQEASLQVSAGIKQEIARVVEKERTRRPPGWRKMDK